uniref:Uncharacterized protein n=1 Tax=Onchocerca volvulus TaxID=6282 RepID=A0A8R1XLX1_ONCVO
MGDTLLQITTYSIVWWLRIHVAIRNLLQFYTEIFWKHKRVLALRSDDYLTAWRHEYHQISQLIIKVIAVHGSKNTWDRKLEINQ